MIPRANRCIFVINELPDLQARIQVALFNILQEGDIQIRGFKLRLPLDVQFVFTANPEDYTNRGSIVTPLKDRIGSQILTHYPKTVETAKKITQQEAKINTAQKEMVYIPAIAYDILEQVGFEARDSEYIDVKSGISARMSITALENLISTAERRALKSKEAETTLRMSDFMGVIPAITGKVELVYEGEQEGAAAVAEDLIGNAVKTIFNKFFPKISKIQRPNQGTPYDVLLDWFLNQSDFQLLDDLSEVDYQVALEKIAPLEALVYKYLPDTSVADKYFWMELVLWALVEYEKLSKDRFTEGYQFKDVLGDFLKGI
jgi:magnesium chelatase subunit I